MAYHAHIRFAVLCLGLAIGAGPGCRTRVPQPEQITTAGLRIDVTRTEYAKRQQRFDVRVKIWNDHDQRISFDLANVRLIFNDREVPAKRGWTNDRPPDVQPKANRDFRWYFELGEEPAQGSYKIEIRDIQKGDMALGETAVFSINA